MGREQLATVGQALAQRAQPRTLSGLRGGEESVTTEETQGVFISDCEGARIVLNSTAAAVMVQGCKECHLSLSGKVRSAVELVGCHGCTVSLQADCNSLLLDKCTSTRLAFPNGHAPAEAKVYTAHCEGTLIEASEGGGEPYRIDADHAPVMGDRWRFLTRWIEELGTHQTEQCDLYGQRPPVAASRASTREPTPERDGHVDTMDAIGEEEELDEVD